MFNNMYIIYNIIMIYKYLYIIYLIIHIYMHTFYIFIYLNICTFIYLNDIVSCVDGRFRKKGYSFRYWKCCHWKRELSSVNLHDQRRNASYREDFWVSTCCWMMCSRSEVSSLRWWQEPHLGRHPNSDRRACAQREFVGRERGIPCGWLRTS